MGQGFEGLGLGEMGDKTVVKWVMGWERDVRQVERGSRNKGVEEMVHGNWETG